MKKLMALLIIMLFPFFVFAKEYEENNIRVKLDVNDEFMVFTRDNLDDNQDLIKLGLTKDKMLDIMAKGGIYFDIVKEDISSEILVVVPDVTLPISNLTGVSTDLLDSFRDEAANKVGASISSTYKNNYDFIVVDYYDKNMNYYIVNYYTVVNSKGYNFQIQKKVEINETDRENLKKIVDSVVFLDFDAKKSTNSDININNKTYKKPFDYKIIIYGAVIGALVGLVTYYVSMYFKKKSSK